MKLVSFRRNGKDGFGAVAGDGVVDLSARLGGKYEDLRSVLKAGALDELRKAAAGHKADVALSQITFLPVIANPKKILCIGLNYHEHREETGRPTTAHPTIFVRFAESQVGHGQPMLRPKESEQLDYEGELAAIIGKGGRHIPAAEAYEHVAGYSCYNDGSVRDWQRHTSQFTPGKNFVASGGFGPWMVTTDEIGDVTKQTLVTRLNGQQMQRTTIDMMIFDIPALIAYISTFTPLKPGDVIVTGTPGGVGHARKPQVFMKPGDVCEVEISGIGTLRNPIAAA